MPTKQRIYVTDHAVLLYLERIHGVDIEGLRERIARNARLASELENLLADCNKVVVRSCGGRYVIADGKIVTVVGKMRKNRTQNRKPSSKSL